jgi:excinuclease UvrABC ATPase subunit
VLVAPSQDELFVVEARAQNQMAVNLAEKQDKARVVAGLSGSGNQYTLAVKQIQKN